MSLQKNQPQVYRRSRHPSDQLRVVFNYLDSLKRWELDTLSKLSASNFTRKTLPACLGVETRTKSEDFEYLRTLRDSLNGAPLELIIYDINENRGKIWVHLFMKTANIESFYNFTFGTGKDKNLVCDLTEFVGSKAFAGDSSVDSSVDSSGSSSSSSKVAGNASPIFFDSL